MDEFDKAIEDLEWKYAELALLPGWIEYVRYAVKQKQTESKLFSGMGERVKNKMEILRSRND